MTLVSIQYLRFNLACNIPAHYFYFLRKVTVILIFNTKLCWYQIPEKRIKTYPCSSYKDSSFKNLLTPKVINITQFSFLSSESRFTYLKAPNIFFLSVLSTKYKLESYFNSSSILHCYPDCANTSEAQQWT